MNLVPSWDLFIILFFIIGIGYGFILQRDRVIMTLISVYVGIVIATTFAPVVQGFFHGDITLFGRFFIKSSASPFTIQTGLFFLTVLILSFKGGLGTFKGKGILSPLEIIIYSVLNTALMLAIIFSFLPEETKATFADQSRLAIIIMKNYNIWLIAPLIIMTIMGFRRGDD